MRRTRGARGTVVLENLLPRAGYECVFPFSGWQRHHDQNEALKGADFVYAKNWSSYEYYGNILSKDRSWTVSKEKMALTNNGKFMHCLPVRRNVVIADEVLDGPHSIVVEQAGNRVWAAQAVISELLKG